MPGVVAAVLSRQERRMLCADLERDGWKILAETDDGRNALSACAARHPDAVVADMVLPGLDGRELARMIRGLRLPLVPGTVLLSWRGMGSAPTLPGVEEVEKPAPFSAVREALVRAMPENRQMTDEARAKLDDVLSRLGVPEHAGRECLTLAAFLAAEDRRFLSRLTTRLYPCVARRRGVSAPAVERSMRYAIEQAWSHGNMEEQYRLFRETIDAAKGKPTCGEMIAQLSELLRLEV